MLIALAVLAVATQAHACVLAVLAVAMQAKGLRGGFFAWNMGVLGLWAM